jgi:hypothetical protein
MGKKTKSFQSIGFGLCAVSMLMGVEVHATDWTVNTNYGGSSGGGNSGSLVYCMTNALSGDTINVDPGVTSIQLLQSLPTITQSNLFMNAPSGLTVDGYTLYVNLKVNASGVGVENFNFINGAGNQISLEGGESYIARK